jgi:hypothetical protein
MLSVHLATKCRPESLNSINILSAALQNIVILLACSRPRVSWNGKRSGAFALRERGSLRLKMLLNYARIFRMRKLSSSALLVLAVVSAVMAASEVALSATAAAGGASIYAVPSYAATVGTFVPRDPPTESFPNYTHRNCRSVKACKPGHGNIVCHRVSRCD